MGSPRCNYFSHLEWGRNNFSQSEKKGFVRYSAPPQNYFTINKTITLRLITTPPSMDKFTRKQTKISLWFNKFNKLQHQFYHPASKYKFLRHLKKIKIVDFCNWECLASNEQWSFQDYNVEVDSCKCLDLILSTKMFLWKHSNVLLLKYKVIWKLENLHFHFVWSCLPNQTYYIVHFWSHGNCEHKTEFCFHWKSNKC